MRETPALFAGDRCCTDRREAEIKIWFVPTPMRDLILGEGFARLFECLFIRYADKHKVGDSLNSVVR